MSILGSRTDLSARVTRATSNALIVTYSDPKGEEVAVGRQKGGAAVLLGFKNGGKANYTIVGGGKQLDVAVFDTTKVSRDGSPLGSIVGEGTKARIESAGASVLAQMHPHAGAKSDSAWTHRLTTPTGVAIGTLTVMRNATAWSLQEFLYWTATWDMVGLGLKAPSAGALLQLVAPVDDILGDLLVAALTDVSTLPRGYVV